MAKTDVPTRPKGFHTLTPHLIVRDAKKAIDFYQKAFGAENARIHYGPDGKSIMHAELKIGDSMLMLYDENPEWNSLSPLSLNGSPVFIHVFVDDADSAFKRAVDAGATVKMPLMDAFWGDRYGQLTDPFGHFWSIATHKEDLTDEEIKERMQKEFKS
jgi:PhnB protein